jgi:hypothetical protein
MLKILKYWAGGLVIFLVVVYIIPENTDFVDKTILIDIPPTPVNIKNPIFYLYNKNPIILKEKLSYYLKNKSNEKISIIVPRLEYFIYYFFFFSMGENSNYTLNVKTTKINIQLIFYYYHKTLIKFFQTIYEYFSEIIKKKGKK